MSEGVFWFQRRLPGGIFRAGVRSTSGEFSTPNYNFNAWIRRCVVKRRREIRLKLRVLVTHCLAFLDACL
jgi:hypothetical protein